MTSQQQTHRTPWNQGRLIGPKPPNADYWLRSLRMQRVESGRGVTPCCARPGAVRAAGYRCSEPEHAAAKDPDPSDLALSAPIDTIPVILPGQLDERPAPASKSGRMAGASSANAPMIGMRSALCDGSAPHDSGTERVALFLLPILQAREHRVRLLIGQKSRKTLHLDPKRNAERLAPIFGRFHVLPLLILSENDR